MVPFVPDPSRPIFCKDHLGMASQFRKPSPQSVPRTADELAPPRPVAPLRPSFSPPPPPSKKEDGFISLNKLKRPPQAPPFFQKPKQNDSLQALRDALKKSMTKDESAPAKSPEPKQEVKAESSKILKPGDKIEL